MDNKILPKISNTIALLAADAVEKANSGHPGMPMGMADIATVLWLKHLNFNPKQPKWINRDRFVMSNGHGSALLYAMLHLSGYDLSLEDLKTFRQLGSKTPGHPENIVTPGVDATTGPLGQGIGNAVGMALGQKIMAERYNAQAAQIFNHKVYCFAGDGCMMEGIASEASSMAGHLGLNNLIVLYDDNRISIAGNTDLTFTEDVCKRYEAYGWYVQKADGHNFEDIDKAIASAKQETKRPSLIALRTIIGKASPNKANTSGVHGSPLGKVELEKTKKALSMPDDLSFYVPEDVRAVFVKRGKELEAGYKSWEKLYKAWRNDNQEKASQLDEQLDLKIPADLEEKLLAKCEAIQTATGGKGESTRKLSEGALQVIAANVASLIGGSADLEPSTLTYLKEFSAIQAGKYSGKNIHFGIREHAMGAILNGLGYYGGFLPYGSTFLVFSDYMRPAIRVAALSDLPTMFIFTHDSIFVGEDGPTHQPIEHVNSLRMIPNVQVFRPADAAEVAVCYSMAMNTRDKPSIMILSRQVLPPLVRDKNFSPEVIKNGAYIAYESSPQIPGLVFIATGSEVAPAIEAAKKIESSLSEEIKNIRVVSMPCYEVYKEQGVGVKDALIPNGVKKVTIEAGVRFGWLDMVDGAPQDTLRIGIDTFGTSAPQNVLAKKYGLTGDAVAAKVLEWIKG